MAFIQFPWRFLGVSIFIVALVGCAVTPYLKNKLLPVYFILIIAAATSTLLYFRPKEYVDDSFFDKFLNVESVHKGIDLTKDYLPIWVQTTEGERFDTPKAAKGEIKVSNLKQTSTTMNFSVDVPPNSLIEVPITYFPGWEVKANDQLISQVSPSKMGLIRFELPKGDYRVNIEFRDTPVRRVGNIISLSSIILVILLLIYGERRKLRWVK